jgi:hypothetical protein
MIRVSELIIVLSVFVPGCGWHASERAAPGTAGPKRVLFDVPPGYKIVNETETLVFLASDHIHVNFFRMDEREFQIRKNSRTQMARDEPRTQFGDIVVPATYVKAGGTAGWKFAILDKNTRKTRTVEYVLSVKGGHVRVTIDRDDYQPFDEAPIEAVFSTIMVGAGEPLGGVDHEFFGRKSEYDLTKGPARLRVFADNCQFLIYDFASDPFKLFPEMNEQTSKRGWTRNEHALWFFTGAHDNAHRIDVRLAAHPETDPAAMRQTVHNLRLPTGTLALFEHPNHVEFRVPPGDYKIYCRAYNLGKEGAAMSDLPDDEFFKHEEWERYELILVPGGSGAGDQSTSSTH